MNTLVQMEQLLQEMKPDASKLYQQNVKAYAVQLRAKAQAMKVLAQQMREEALAHHRNIVGRGANKTVGGVRPAPVSEHSPNDSPNDSQVLETAQVESESIVASPSILAAPTMQARRTRQPKVKPVVQQ